MKRLILSLLIATSSLGQLWSPAQLKNHIATNLPSGSSITALKLRETLTNVVTSTLFGTNNLSDLNSPSAARSNLGLAIGIDVQSYDSQLDELASGSLTGYVKAAGSGSYTASSTIPATDLSGNLPVARLDSGTAASSSTFWRGDGTWSTVPSSSSTNGGTVTSVAASVPGFLSVSGSPITTSGTLAITYSGTALPAANGGTGITALGSGVATALGGNIGSAGAFVVSGGALGTPSSGALANATGLPISTGVSGLGSGVATALATPTSANLAAALTDETGTSGGFVRADGATVTNMVFGVAGSAQKVSGYDSSGNLSFYNVTKTEIERVAGVTSAIQTQLDGKESSITTLPVSKGGSGAGTLTGHISGNGTSAFTASSTIPATDLSGTIDNARLDSAVVLKTYAQTLTNKRVTPRSFGISFTDPLTIATDSYDIVEITMTGNLSLLILSGTPTDGQPLRVSFNQDSTGGRVITWPSSIAFGTDYTAAMVPTTANAKWQMTLTYNAADSKWRVTGMARGF